MTTKEEISIWFDEGFKKGFDWLIVACDTFEHADYPVYLNGNIYAVIEKRNSINKDEYSRVMEVYNLFLDKETQLNLKRCRADLL